MAGLGFDRRFRPLLSATLASGLVALAMFDFAATIWGGLKDPESRGLVAAAARTAYAGFFLQALVLLGMYLAGRRAERLAVLWANIIGVGLFLWCSILVGRLLSVAFNIEAPAGEQPPDAVALFFAISTLAVALFVIWVAGRIGWSRFQVLQRRRRRARAAASAAIDTTVSSEEASAGKGVSSPDVSTPKPASKPTSSPKD